jgi:large subunit ribosomal protein L10
MLVFQHNNITAMEWAALRRELRSALAAVPPPAPPPGGQAPVDIAPGILLQVVRTHMLNQALKVDEFFDPASVPSSAKTGAKAEYTHDLSMAAYKAVKAVDKAIPEDSMYAQMAPLMIGPLALLTFPAVSPQHLAAALSILSPSPPAFPAPTRKKSPGYYDLTTQSALHKLLLIGARIDSKVFDLDGVRWVGGIAGGLDGLRAQLVAMLQGAGLGLTTALEGASKNLWATMESRRTMLEDEQKGGEQKGGEQKEGEKKE